MPLFNLGMMIVMNDVSTHCRFINEEAVIM